MILPINDKYRISSDRNQWIIQEYKGIATKDGKGRKAGEPVWKSISFHTNINSTVRRLAEMQIRESDATTLAEALRVVPEVAAAISQAFDLVAEVNWKPDSNPRGY